MAIGGPIVVTADVSDDSTTVDLTVTPSGSDRLITVGVVWKDSVAITSVVFDPGGGDELTLTEDGTIDEGSGNKRNASLFHGIAPVASAKTLRVTFASGPREVLVCVRTWTGVDQTTPRGTVATATGNTATPTVDVTAATNDVVEDSCIAKNTALDSVGAGQTEDFRAIVGEASDGGGFSHEAGAATVTMSWNAAASTAWAIIGIAIKPATAVSPSGVGVQALADLTQVGVGAMQPSSAGIQLLANALQVGTGVETFSANGIQLLADALQVGVGLMQPSSVGIQLLANALQVGTGVEIFSANGVQLLANALQSGVGLMQPSGVGIQLLANALQVGTGVEIFSANGIQLLANALQSGVGLMQPSGVGIQLLANLLQAGIGVQVLAVAPFIVQFIPLLLAVDIAILGSSSVMVNLAKEIGLLSPSNTIVNLAKEIGVQGTSDIGV